MQKIEGEGEGRVVGNCRRKGRMEGEGWREGEGREGAERGGKGEPTSCVMNRRTKYEGPP